MPRRDPRVDSYIAKAPAFARPILKKLRSVLLGADRTLQEDIKWGAPTMVKDGIVCSFVGFRKHVALWFHKGSLLEDPAKILNASPSIAMRAAHFTSATQIKTAPISMMLKQAVQLNTAGVKAPRRSAGDKAVGTPRKATAKKTPRKAAKQTVRKAAKQTARKAPKKAGRKAAKRGARAQPKSASTKKR